MKRNISDVDQFIVVKKHKQEHRLLNSFVCWKRIGSGTSGTVYRAFDKEHGKTVAIKRINNYADGNWERHFLQKFRNKPNIIQIQDSVIITKNQNQKIYLILEYCSYDLHKIIQTRVLTPLLIQQYMSQLLRGFESIHDKKIIHCDLKPQNILIHKDNSLRIADFGLASPCEKDMSPNVVTLWYRAPELLRQERQYDESIDIWSIGCVFAEMLLKEPLFRKGNEKTMLSLQQEFTKSIHQLFPREDFGNDAIDLLEKMLQYEPKKRIDIKQALKHPYIVQNIL